ncbi:putative 2-nitropropane dioxygenase precursor [Podospora fimiseda]|uniref:2-nitropropane dioxygenase n=1 Tax=Podospora fimiseda TaxID=252190 RepID=A0AAN7BIE0_9PEZI|nr:putative 2-nitropropane dioxygenase precursor [Podospora fimiseda]
MSPHQHHHPIQSLSLSTKLSSPYPWTSLPLIVSAPMRVMSGPSLAVAVSSAGGLGFIGPGLSPDSTAIDLEECVKILDDKSSDSKDVLPVGVGFQLWNGDLKVACEAVGKYKPAAAWLFAPKEGQREINEWIKNLRGVSKKTKIWVQVGALKEIEGILQGEEEYKPDVIVVQGFEAGGHGRTKDGAPLMTLLPEVLDLLGERNTIPIFAAGGIADGRGVSAALCLGAAGVVMGTRFLGSKEARIKRGYQDAVLEARDGGANTVKTHLYNHLRGTWGWPEEEWTPRTIVNKSWEEENGGVEFEELKKRHDDAVTKGDKAWGKEEGRTATYAGMGVGLVKEVKGAGEIVEDVRKEAKEILKRLGGNNW